MKPKFEPLSRRTSPLPWQMGEIKRREVDGVVFETGWYHSQLHNFLETYRVDEMQRGESVMIPGDGDEKHMRLVGRSLQQIRRKMADRKFVSARVNGEGIRIWRTK